MKRRQFPTRETLEKEAEKMRDINVPAVEVLLQFLQVSDEIQYSIFDVLEKEYQLSEGKLMVMIILYQSAGGLAPSKLAEKANVTRATISAMLQRMIRDGFASSFSDAQDGRGKYVSLTDKGRAFLDEVLPGHFMRITKVMSRLTGQEQSMLVQLLKKIVAD